MHIITKTRLREFWDEHPGAEIPLARWFHITRRAIWTDFASLRRDFPQADVVGKFVVFNIGGNKFRLIVEINYQWRKVFIRGVLTHREYDKDAWKA
jgi:mRNA interferase HigB